MLTVTSNTPALDGLLPGELELILPSVSRLLQDLAEAAHEASTEK